MSGLGEKPPPFKRIVLMDSGLPEQPNSLMEYTEPEIPVATTSVEYMTGPRIPGPLTTSVMAPIKPEPLTPSVILINPVMPGPSISLMNRVMPGPSSSSMEYADPYSSPVPGVSSIKRSFSDYQKGPQKKLKCNERESSAMDMEITDSKMDTTDQLNSDDDSSSEEELMATVMGRSNALRMHSHRGVRSNVPSVYMPD